MTREDTKQLVRVIMGIYPNWNPKDVSDTIDAWTWALEEYRAEDIKVALKMYQKTSGSAFAPSTAELIAMLRKPKELNALSEGEAWAKVRVALRNGIYGAEEEFNKLPPEVQRAVGNASMIRQWAMLDSSELDTVVGSNFMRNYKTILNREAQKEAIPVEIQTLIGEKLGNLLEVAE